MYQGGQNLSDKKKTTPVQDSPSNVSMGDDVKKKMDYGASGSSASLGTIFDAKRILISCREVSGIRRGGNGGDFQPASKTE